MVSRRTTCRVVVSIQATTPTCVPTRIFAPSVLRLNPSAPETGMHLTTCWVVTGITSTQFRSMALAKINWCTWEAGYGNFNPLVEPVHGVHREIQRCALSGPNGLVLRAYADRKAG